MALATHLYILVIVVTHLVITLYGMEKTLAPSEFMISIMFSIFPGDYITCLIYSNIMRVAVTISSPDGKGFIFNNILDLRHRMGLYILSLPPIYRNPELSISNTPLVTITGNFSTQNLVLLKIPSYAF